MSEAFFGSLPGLPANRDSRRPMAGLFGDPLRLAGHQFRLAQDLCAECRDYHALWPYRRLSGMVFGVETGASIVEALFRDVTPPNGRVLIVGSADAGLTDLVVRATKGLAPSIDVVDRCATPLAVCRRYAEMHGLSISTHRLDVRGTAPPNRYDVVFWHCVLQFLPPQHRAGFVRRIGRAMRKRGALVVVERVRTGEEDSSRRGDYAAATIEALAAQDIELPEDEASFRLRLERIVNLRRTRITSCLAPPDLQSCFAEAGFRSRALPDRDRLQTVFLPNGESVTLEVASAFR